MLLVTWVVAGHRNKTCRKAGGREMGEVQMVDQAVKAKANREGKYLTFSLAGEEYGIGIRKVKEIIGMMTITSIPQMQSVTPARTSNMRLLHWRVSVTSAD